MQTDDPSVAKNLVEFIKGKTVDVEQVYYLWHNRSQAKWLKKNDIYTAFAEKALSAAEPLLAFDILKEASHYYPENLRVRQLMGLTFARLGLTKEANRMLEKLFKEDQNLDEETIGLLARTYKDLWLLEKSESHFDKSIAIYGMSYKKFKSTWAGINLATLYKLNDKPEMGQEILGEVKKVCMNEINSDQATYWTYATMGEANLLEKNYQKALYWFQKGVDLDPDNLGNINSTRRNMKLIIEKLNVPLKYKHKIEGILSVPKVILFSGHRVDAPDREVPRFPSDLVEHLEDKVEKYIDSLGPCIGYCSAANGADLIFIDKMVKAGNKVYCLIPFEEKQFIEESVRWSTEENDEWVERFENIKDKVKLINLKALSIDLKDESFTFSNKVMYGLAKMKADHLDTTLQTLAVWNPSVIEGGKVSRGGTSHFMTHWQKNGHKVDYFDLTNLKTGRAFFRSAPNLIGNIKLHDKSGSSETRGILFMDAVNYSKLKDQEFVLYERIIQDVIDQIMKSYKFNILSFNTWGDAIHLVFKGVEETGIFALKFNEALKGHPWSRSGLSQPVQIRTAVHAGPIFKSAGLMNSKAQYVGAHICRTARIEPITPQGQIYTTLEFASLANAELVESFECAYIGKIYVSKDKLQHPIFHLRGKDFEGTGTRIY
ncbi:MAG: TRAFs-binding domain-containing protein [Bacteriovoracaceae bacterium]